MKSGISARELTPTLKKKKKKKSTGWEWTVKHSPNILARKEKATTTSSGVVLTEIFKFAALLVKEVINPVICVPVITKWLLDCIFATMISNKCFVQ